MTEVAKRIVKKMIGIKPLVGGYPYRASLTQQISDKKSFQLLQDSMDRRKLQRISLSCQSRQAQRRGYPYVACILDVTNGNVRCITNIFTTADVGNITLFVKLIAVDAVARHLPHCSLRVAIHLHRSASQHATNGSLATRRCHPAHRLQVHDHRALVVGYPQALMAVFSKPQTRATVALMRRLKSIAVVAHRSTSKAGHPDKSLTIHKDMVHVVVRQSARQVKARHIIAFKQRA